MIIAGTVSAYLKLSIEDFRTNLMSAITMLGQLSAAGISGSAGILTLEDAAGTVGASLAAMSGSSAAFAAAFASASQNAQTSVHGMAASIAGSMVYTANSSVSGMSSVAASVGVLAGAKVTASTLSKGICSNVLSPMQVLKTNTTAAGAAAGAGFSSGLQSKRSSVISVARSIANSARSVIQSVLKIASPSKVMREVGEYTTEGLALGMETMIPRVADSASAVARTVERSAAVSLPLPVMSSPTAVPIQQRITAAGSSAAPVDMSALSERLDSLLDYFRDTEPVLRLDGRALGRMVREYA